MEWFEWQWTQAVQNQVTDVKFRNGEHGVQLFCQIGKLNVLIRLMIWPGQEISEHAMAVDPEQRIYCDRYKISTVSFSTGILTQLEEIRREISCGTDPEEACRQHLVFRLAEFQKNPDHYEGYIQHHSRLPGRKICMFPGGAPGQGKKRR